MPRVASTISTGNSKRDAAMAAKNSSRQQDGKRRADQDQDLGEAGETVGDEGAVKGGGLIRRHITTTTPATDQKRDRAPRRSAGAVFSPPHRAGQQQRHGADRQDQFGQKDEQIGLKVHGAAPFCISATLPSAHDPSPARSGCRGSAWRPTGVVTSNTGLG